VQVHEPLGIRIEYWRAGESRKLATEPLACGPGKVAVIELEKLVPDKESHYMLHTRGADAQQATASEDRRFVTQRAKGSTFTVAV